MQGRKDRQQTNKYLYNLYSVKHHEKKQNRIRHKGHMEMKVLVFIGGSGGPL